MSVKKNHSLKLEEVLVQAQAAAGRKPGGQKRRTDISHSSVSTVPHLTDPHYIMTGPLLIDKHRNVFNKDMSTREHHKLL